MKYFLFLIISICLIFCSNYASASEKDNTIIPYSYMDQGPLIQIPGMAGGIVLGVPGVLIGLLVVGPVLSTVAQEDDGQFAFGAAATGVIFFEIGYTIVATPFWLLKKIFYDFPYKIFNESNSDLTPRLTNL